MSRYTGRYMLMRIVCGVAIALALAVVRGYLR